MYAVSDEARHHRSSYFGSGPKAFSLNYDEIWQERGGHRYTDEFFVLPVIGAKRDLATIPSKKRSMYRKRYELIDYFEAAVVRGLRDGFVTRSRDDFAK